MAKVSLARKRELEQPDPLLVYMRNFLNYVIEKRNMIMTIAGTVLLLLLIISLTIHSIKKKESNSFRLLTNITNQLRDVEKNSESEQVYKNIEDQFEKFLKDYSGTGAEKFATLIYANLMYEQKDYDKVINLYEKALKKFAEQAEIKVFILNGLAYAFEEKKDLQSAIKYFEEIVSSSEKIMKDDALFHLGMLYDEIGQQDKSKEAFNKILSDYTNSTYIDVVKAKLAG